MELYYEDPYLKEIEVEIKSYDDQFMEFDRTIIFPGGGGQPPDSGYIIGKDFRARILFSKKDDNRILHRYEIIEGKIPEKGKLVLDWERRYNLMKMHTGQHILYRSIENLYNVKFQKVIFNENESSLFIMGDISIDDIVRAEESANDIIKRDLQVKIEYENIENVDNTVRIRRDRIRDERVRIVEIDGYDRTACSGIHVKSTGEINIIFIKSIKKSDFTEIKFMVGNPAMNHILNNARIMRKISNNLKIDPNNIEKKLSEALNEIEILKKSLYEISSKMFVFEKKESNGKTLYYSDFPYGDIKGIERYARRIADNENATVLYGSEIQKKIFILTKDMENIEKVKKIKEEKGLKGGGNNNYYVFSLEDQEFRIVFNEILDKLIS